MTNIYQAVFAMSGESMWQYLYAWEERYPDKQHAWKSDIEPYLNPPYMLWQAPLTAPFLSFFRIIEDVNGIEHHHLEINPHSVRCTICDLPVTRTIDLRDAAESVCLKCFEKTYHLDLD